MVNNTTGIDQILAEIYDYIRCTNLADQSLSTLDSYTPCISTTSKSNQMALGQVVPIQISGTPTAGKPQGMGRIATISELGIFLTKIEDRQSTGSIDSVSNLATKVTIIGGNTDPGAPTSFTPLSSASPPAQQTCIEWAVIPNLFSPMAGYVALGNNLRIHYSAFNLVINGQAITPSTNTILDLYDTGRIGASSRDSLVGGSIGWVNMATSQAGSAAPPGRF